MLQGEREMARYNKTLGKFQLVGIPPAPRGIPQIEVTFDIDANGIVHVSAKDLGTGNEQKITITASSGLSEQDIERMMKDAESHADEDQKARELAEVKNNAENLVYSTEKSLRDMGDKVDAATKAEIEAAAAEVKKALEGDDVDDIKAKTDALMQASHKLAEAVYQQAQQQQPSGDGDGGGAGRRRERRRGRLRGHRRGRAEVSERDRRAAATAGAAAGTRTPEEESDHGHHQMGPVPRDDPGRRTSSTGSSTRSGTGVRRAGCRRSTCSTPRTPSSSRPSSPA